MGDFPDATKGAAVGKKCVMAPMEIHKVCMPPVQSAIKAFVNRLAEIFFPENPLERFKHQPAKKKWILGFQYFFPILQWGPEYNLQLFKSDIVAGLTLASLAIPQGISYAKLAHLPPLIGLYSSFVPPLVYAVLGSSRHLAVGPVSIASLVMGGMLRDVISPHTEADLYLRLAFTATFFAGLFQASLGFLRLGFIIDFLSQPTLLGFCAGASVIVMLQQLKGLLGIVHFTNKMQIIPVLESVYTMRHECDVKTNVLGLSFLIFLFGARHFNKKHPKHFWVSAAAPLTSVIISTILVFALKAHLGSVSVIGKLAKGLNPPSFDLLYFKENHHLSVAIKTGLITAILSLTEGIAVGRTFASLENYQVDGNKEMIAIGGMNMIGSCASCFITTGSFSRSAINYNAGGKSAVSNIVMAATVVVTLLFLIPLFQYTPNLILSAIIVTSVIGLIDYQGAIKLWKVDKLDFLACLCAFLGVLFTSVQVGLLIAVGVSVFKILLQVSRPSTAVLGKIPETDIYQNLSRYKEASRVPPFIVIAVESPIYFANATYLQERLVRWVREEEQRAIANQEPVKYVIFDMSAVTAIDSSGIGLLLELRKIFEKKGLRLVLVNPVGEVMQKLFISKALEQFDDYQLYLTVGEAIVDNMTKAVDEAL